MKKYKKKDCGHCRMPEVFYRYMDKEITKQDARQLKDYLAANKECCNHLEFEQAMRGAIIKTQSATKAPRSLKKKISKKVFG
jgi:anti-sigma factor (TIGR02949 family)